MKIIIGADHAGYRLKEEIKEYLAGRGHNIEDIGASAKKTKDDYPDYAKKAAKKIQKNKKTKAILVCGTGTGMCIKANRYKGIRAAVIFDNYSAKKSRQDNDANIACLRARHFDTNKAKKLVNTWLNEKFSGKKRHKRRIKKLYK